jgi:hypothetical protein
LLSFNFSNCFFSLKQIIFVKPMKRLGWQV